MNLMPAAGAAGDLDLDLHDLLVGILQQVVHHVGVHDERLEVVANSLNGDVLVDEVDGLGEGVPEKFAVARRGLDADCKGFTSHR